MSQQLAQNPFLASLSESSQSMLNAAQRLPVSFWRGLVLILAVFWITTSAAKLFWIIFPVPEVEPPKTLAAPLKTDAVASSGGVSFDTLAPLKKVFGEPSAVVAGPVETPPPADVNEDAVTTKLKLKLHGVFVSSVKSKGSAIIADGNKQVLYSIGDEIEGNRGVKLARVMEKKVILDNKGRSESLWLFSEEDFKNAVSSRSSARRPSRPARQSKPSAPAQQERRTANREQLPKNIGDVVRFSVHREGGKMVGYRIRPGRDRELFNQFGLKANDIVTSVNGIEVNDPKQIRTVYKSMKTATEAQLSILRDGVNHSITISLN